MSMLSTLHTPHVLVITSDHRGTVNFNVLFLFSVIPSYFVCRVYRMDVLLLLPIGRQHQTWWLAPTALFYSNNILFGFVFLWNLERISVYLCIYMYYENFFEKNKNQKQDSQAFMRVNRLVFCYYSLRKLDWAEMAPCP